MVRKYSLTHSRKKQIWKSAWLTDLSEQAEVSSKCQLYGVLVFLFEFFKALGYDGDVGLCKKSYENAPF